MKKVKKEKKGKKKYNAVHAYTAMLKLFRENNGNKTKDKIVNGTELSISKVIESTINEKAKKHGYKNGKAD